MAASKSSLESEIAAWLVKAIAHETFIDAIDGRTSIDTAFNSFSDDSVIPAFGFDHLSRRANIRAAATVLRNLTLLEVVSVDKSISLTTGEVLRPDVLCFNPESRTLVVFEIKRDKLTERQAITELAGYEQELRNALPLLGDFDVNFIVLSTQWDTLLDHAVSNFNAWSGKYCLALKVSTGRDRFSLTCHVPNAWQLRGGIGLPEEALQTVDLVLYEEESEESGDQVPSEILTAINIIARSGDRHDSHGFLMLWRDTADYGNGRWALTLCGVDPFAMHEWCSNQGLPTRSSKLTEYLSTNATDLAGRAPEAIFKIAKEAFPLFSGRYRPTFENLFSWTDKLFLIRRRAIPVRFEFWGVFGDYAREFVCHSLVRNRYLPYIEHNGLDWCEPSVALPLVGIICGDVPFRGGEIRCRDALSAGVTIGLHEALSKISDASAAEEGKLHALLRWTMLESVRLGIEMAEIYRTVAEILKPMPTLSSAVATRTASVVALADWVEDHMIGEEHPEHQLCFQIGRSGAVFFSPWLDQQEQQAFLDAHGETLASSLRNALRVLLAEDAINDLDLASMPALHRFLDVLRTSAKSNLADGASPLDVVSAEELLRAFRDHGVEGLDEMIPAVLHTVEPLTDLVVDWDGMRESIRKIFESGCQWPVVYLSQNGSLGVGEVEPAYRNVLDPVQNPGLEVYFCDEKAVAHMLVKMKWPELEEMLGKPRLSDQ